MRLFKSSKKNESITDQISRVLTQEKLNFEKLSETENRDVIKLGVALHSGKCLRTKEWKLLSFFI